MYCHRYVQYQMFYACFAIFVTLYRYWKTLNDSARAEVRCPSVTVQSGLDTTSNTHSNAKWHCISSLTPSDQP